MTEAAPTLPARRACFREFTPGFLPLREGAPSLAWDTAPATLIFFATLVPLFYFQFMFYFFYFVIFLQHSLGQALKRAVKETGTGEAGNRIKNNY